MSLTNLLDLLPAEIEALVESLGAPRYRGRQIADWIYRKGVTDLDRMTNLPRDLREALAERACVDVPAVERQTPSQDGSQKFVFRFPDGALGELTTGSGFTGADNSVEIYGTEGSAILSGVDLASRDLTQDGFLKVYRRCQAERRWIVSPIVPRFKTGGFHQQNALHFLEALALGMPPPITLEDGRRAVGMIVAAYAAARTGQRTLVSPPGGTA